MSFMDKKGRGAYKRAGNVNATKTETTASKIHNPHANRLVQSPPQAGTQTKTNILIIVANPIGNVPRNIDCTG